MREAVLQQARAAKKIPKKKKKTEGPLPLYLHPRVHHFHPTGPGIILAGSKIRIHNLMNFEDIENIDDLEKVSVESVWQNFERLAAFIFEKNDFRVNVNTVKTLNKKRRQYDVIARKSDRTFLVECKRWSGNRYRLSALKKAIVQHKERTTFYENITNDDAIPLIVTLIEEEIRVFEGVPLVPVLKLNAFIRELDNHPDGDVFCDYEEDILSPDDMPTESDDFSGTGE